MHLRAFDNMKSASKIKNRFSEVTSAAKNDTFPIKCFSQSVITK